MQKKLKYRTLLGHSNIDFSIECLQSFIDKSATTILLEIFQDGTLTEADREKLDAQLKKNIIIEKQDREQKALQKLSKYPNCLKWRANNFYAAKFFDTMLYDDADFLYIDSDIYFFQKYKLPELGRLPIFMVDGYTTYSFGPLDFLKIKQPIFGKINSGFIYFPPDMFDLDFIEYLLGDPFLTTCFYGKWCGVAEQTLWAFLAAKYKIVGFFDTTQATVAAKKNKITSENIAIHLTRPFRHQFEHLKSLPIFEKESSGYKPLNVIKSTKFLSNVGFASEWIINKSESKLTQLLHA